MPTIPQADLEQYGEVIDRLVTTPRRQVPRQHVPADEGRGHVRRRPRQVRTPAVPARRRADLRARQARRQRAHPHRQLPPAALPRRRDGRPRPAAATLALSLDLGLGAKPFFANEPPLVKLMEEACRAVGLLPMPYEQAIERDHTAVVVEFPITDHEGSRRAAEEADGHARLLARRDHRAPRAKPQGPLPQRRAAPSASPRDRCKVDHIVGRGPRAGHPHRVRRRRRQRDRPSARSSTRRAAS